MDEDALAEAEGHPASIEVGTPETLEAPYREAEGDPVALS